MIVEKLKAAVLNAATAFWKTIVQLVMLAKKNHDKL